MVPPPSSQTPAPQQKPALSAERAAWAEEAFHAALEQSAAGRAEFITRECAGDGELREHLLRLLAAHESAGDFFADNGVSPVAIGGVAIRPWVREGDHDPDRTVEALRHPSSLVWEHAGDSIGAYKLREQLGEGGFGTVWVAEQEHPVRRRVALKIIKLGMGTKEVIARFEQERQALAIMDHPNIAKVLDAGVTEQGRPYFVMELVRGVKITEYCDEHQLPTAARIELFITVCRAVQHAHQKGVIHRDLKPSNILVSVNDGVAVPKIIDFGIAKASQGRLIDQTIYTQFEQMIGTPLYMSPEQAEMTSVDIDTRSDVYSLGVLLYELLTGSTPIDARTLTGAGVDEMRRMIREVDPPRPSMRIRTLSGDDRTTAAQRRGVNAGKLPIEIRGDLDWIAMKCLEKDRARRYETANGLAQDLQRYLDHEPISARPPGTLYRLRKTVQRHRLAFAAGAIVVASLLAASVLSTSLYLRERDAFRRFKDSEAELATTRERRAFERAMHDGLMGDADRMEAAMADSRDRISAPHLLMLRGGRALLLGQYDNAIHSLEEAIGMSSDSAAAQGLLAAAHFQNGQWCQYERDLHRLVPIKPDDASPEDYIFKALALGYTWPDKALDLLDSKDAPSSAMTPVVRAEVEIWSALRTGNVSDALTAVSTIDTVKDLAGKNPAVLGVSVSARLVAAELDASGRSRHLAEADADARRMQAIFQDNPNVPGAVAIRTLQLQALGRDDEAREMLRVQHIKAPGGLVTQRYALELFRAKRTEEAMRMINPTRSAPDAFFHLRMLAASPDNRARVLEGYHEFRARYAGTSAEVFAALIPLLLGDKQLAMADSRKFKRDAGARIAQLPVPLPTLVDFFCGNATADELVASAGRAPIAISEVQNALGYWSLAEGDQTQARRHFQASVDAGAFLSNAHLDSRIHLAWLAADAHAEAAPAK